MAGPAPEPPALPQQLQQGLSSSFDPQQVQQMSAMMAMAAAGMAGGGMPTGVPTGMATGVATGVDMPAMPPLMTPGIDATLSQDPVMAQVYAQMFAQYLQQAQMQAFAGGFDMSGMAPSFPPSSMGAPYSQQAPVPAPAPIISVSVDGMKYQYQLTEDDLQKVFSRYGTVKEIKVDEAGTTAQIEFQDFQNAQTAMNDLNGKVLNGLDGTLRLAWVNQGPAAPASVPSPYPAMPQFPGAPDWGFAGMSAWPGAAAPDLGSMLAMGAGMGAAPPPPVLPPPAVAQGGADSGAALPQALGGDVATGATVESKSTALAHTKGVRKHTCRFLIGVENDKEFQVVRRIIGSKGANMKKVVKQTEAKLRLRGVGSGYFEGAGHRESSEPLQLCISCTSSEGYQTAVRLVEELLEDVYEEYRQFCKDHNRPVPDLHASPQLVSAGQSARGGGGGGGAVGGGDVDDGSGMEGESPSKRDSSHRRGRRSRAKKGDSGKSGVERGEAPSKAPAPEEIERCIDQRNEARRQCNFTEADRIRESLHERGVALMDEPGARGKGTEVTTWRYWRE
mmetsp:Transcript_79533/g.170478  ORF Transcript_79533/g.170478 Transcript_79533/m.170478 type:complete len:561 (-) Transcript_79533:41-1723(-)